MRLIQLKVETFRCIERARIDFSPGLNVLHGPNDLGKSTLAAAIRAALLLAHGQREHKEFIPWSADVAPKVELDFEVGGDFFRVAKSFGDGSRGQSLLSTSKDGRDYAVGSKGREVDERLRALLQWGVPAPGGKSRVKGMPETFLSELLIPDQSQVARILSLSLEQDPDESGKEHLTRVLQAMATDPTYKKVLEHAETKVDEAYTPKGQRKTSKGSVWTEARERINEAQREVERLNADAVNSEAAEDRVRELFQRVEELRAHVEVARSQHDHVVAVWQAHLERQRAATELEAATLALRELDEQLQSVEASRTDVLSLETQLEDASAARQAAQDAVSQAQRALEAAERVTVTNSELDLAVRKTELAEIDAELARWAQEGQRAAQAADLVAQLRSLEERVLLAIAERTSCEQKLGFVEAELRTLEDSLRKNEQLAAFSRYVAAERAFEANERTLTKLRAARERGESARARAEELERELSARTLPSRADLKALRTLELGLESARAALGGVSVELRLISPLGLRIDADESTERTVVSERLIEATSSIRLGIEGVGELIARAGRPDDRRRLDELAERWDREARPALMAAGEGDLDGVSRRLDRAEADRRAREACLVDAQAALEAATDLAVQAAEPAALRQAVLDVLDELAALGEVDLEVLRVRLQAIERPDLENTRLQKQRDVLSSAATRIQVELAGVATGLDRDQAEAIVLRSRVDSELQLLGAAPTAVLERITRAREGLERRQRERRAELVLIEERDRATRDRVMSAIGAAREKLEQDQARLRATEEQRAHSATLLAAARAVWAEREARAQALDRGVAVLKVSSWSELLRQLPQHPPIDEAQLAEARGTLARKEADLDTAEGELQVARGALEQVGGNVVREWKTGWVEALEVRLREQQELDVDYEAWRLLAAALKDEEKAQASHLGRVLAQPIGQRLEELTKGRYAGLELGPSLDEPKIVAHGSARPVGSFSVGTREQLAMLIRICLAEKLESCLILDDQLTQSDPARVAALGELLRSTAQSIQLIVLTCRPADYAVEGAKSIDLEQSIVRYG